VPARTASSAPDPTTQAMSTPRSRRAEQAAADRQRTSPGNSAETSEPTAEFEEGVLTDKSSRIAAAHRLLRKPRRAEAGEFLAEGTQAVAEAVAAELRSPGTVKEIYLTKEAGLRHVELVRAAFAARIEVTQVTERAAAALSDTVSPQGLVARCAMTLADVDEVIASEPRLIAVLVETNDPGNAGTIIRLADAAGADAVIFAGESVDPFNPKAVRASTGSLFHLPVARATDVGELLMQLSEAGLSVLATTGGHANTDLDTATDDGILDLPTAWLFGSEAHGLPAVVIAAADESISVPIYGAAESLNLATAAAICLYASARAHRAEHGKRTAMADVPDAADTSV
jgi:TrmH family RNA methyltransferase